MKLRLWSEAEFAASRPAWQALLRRSAADPVFMSWDWLHAWWMHHRDSLASSLRLLAVETADGELVALLPLHLHRVRLVGPLHIARLECLGTAWRNGDAAFTEYFDVIVAPEHESAVMDLLVRWITADDGWSEFVVSCVRRGASILMLAQRLNEQGLAMRRVEALEAHCANLDAGLEGWLARRSSSARRRAHNQRGKLRNPKLRRIADTSIDDALQRLQDWRGQRFGSATATSLRSFERDVAHRFAQRGALRLTILEEEGTALSVLFDLQVGDVRYYIASAFAPEAPAGISPAYLHFGYSVERAIREGVTRYDLLAGEGRHRDYKHELADTSEMLESRQLVRGALLRGLYRLKGAM